MNSCIWQIELNYEKIICGKTEKNFNIFDKENKKKKNKSNIIKSLTNYLLIIPNIKN